MSDIEQRLREAGDEMRTENQNGWPVVCDMAADEIASLRSKLEEAEGARGWQPIETAPKDGQVVWAYLYQSGIRAVRFGTAEEWAELEGGSPDEYEDCWVEADNESETWSPRWWLPYGSLPPAPLASLREADHA